ncbi:MAG TPA: efflux RND transporter periplasmic adaptor subunit, partial [Candidatus Eisenbacteria bacterium]
MRLMTGAALLLLVTGSAGCTKKSGEAGGARAATTAPGKGPGGRGGAVFPVEVVPVPGQPVEYAVSAVGSVDAFEIVQVTARVPGAVEQVHFREGDRVKEGAILVEIEPARYRLSVQEAEAAVARAEAALAEAESGLARREGANTTNAGLIPGEELDAWRTRVATQKAEVASSQAALEMANRNLRDSQARAPFSGIIQTRDVQTGRYVTPGSLLTTLVRRDPLLLRFQVPDGDAASLAPGMPARFSVRGAGDSHSAKIISVAESADPTSRMVAVTAEVVNPVESLRPGAFAEVTVPVGAPRSAPVIPQTAVRPSERGFLAYVVSGGMARERVLALGLRTADGLVE